MKLPAEYDPSGPIASRTYSLFLRQRTLIGRVESAENSAVRSACREGLLMPRVSTVRRRIGEGLQSTLPDRSSVLS